MSAAPSLELSRRQLLGTSILALAILSISGSGLYLLYDSSSEHLDREFGQRLQSVAVAAAATVPADSMLSWWLAKATPVDVLLLTRRLERVELDNQLAKILVYQSDRTVLLDTSQLLERGESDPFLALDLAAVEQASVGIASYSRLQRAGGDYMKAGYAPVIDDFGEVVGLVGVMASADFFATLEALRNRLLAVGSAMAALVVVLTLIYLGYARRLARARVALHRAERLSAMGRMAAGIAHEIRNPLGIIKNTAQLLREELAEQGKVVDLVEFIPEEIDRLNETLTGYLDFAREDALRVEEVELCRLVRRTLRLMQPDFDNASIRTLDNLDELSAVKLRADPRRLQQVLLNLLLNSVQAMPDGGEIELRLQTGDGTVELRIRDTGVGLDPAVAEHLFEAFETSKEKGSGLGLHVARRIVEQHGGRLTLEGAVGQGATAVMILPRSGVKEPN